MPTPESVDGVAKPTESSAIGKRPARPPFIQGNAESSGKEGLGVPAQAFPHFKPSVTIWSEPREREE